MARAPVRLNVYDMYWLNDYAATLGVGIFHSGVEVYGVEYAYGGHPFAFSGVFENSPQDAEELGENFKFRQSILLGETDFTAGDVRHMVQLLGHEYRGDKYHLISKNCNHFTSALAKTLTGNDIPGWINRLATISGSIPFLERFLPQEWLTPVALQESIRERRRSEDSHVSAVESAQEATEEAVGSRKCSAAMNGGEKALAQNGPREIASQGRTSSPVPPLARIWNSIRSIGNDAVTNNSPAPTPRRQ